MTNKINFNVGQFGKTKQLSLYKESEGLPLVKGNKNNSERDIRMAKQPYVKPTEPSSVKRKIVETDNWLSLGGKGFFIKVDGKDYMTSQANIKRLLDGKIKGVKLGLLVAE